MGELVHTLPEGESVLGVTVLAGELYVLRDKPCDQVEVYDVTTYRLRRCLTVPNALGLLDMTSCEYNRCLYISNGISDCVHRLDVGLEGAATRWEINTKPMGLSVNTAHNVLVTCNVVHKIKEFSSDGVLLRELKFRDDDIYPWHAIQTRSGQFIVCHGGRSGRSRHVCMISSEEIPIPASVINPWRTVPTHRGQVLVCYEYPVYRVCTARVVGQYNVPDHSADDDRSARYSSDSWMLIEDICSYLAVDDDGSVFVADVFSRRVTLTSPKLKYAHNVVSHDQLKGEPGRMYFHNQTRKLYVADNERNGSWYTTGRVLVFSV